MKTDINMRPGATEIEVRATKHWFNDIRQYRLRKTIITAQATVVAGTLVTKIGRTYALVDRLRLGWGYGDVITADGIVLRCVLQFDLCEPELHLTPKTAATFINSERKRW
jgi:hypothetical protein